MANIACRIFQEQLDLVKELPEQERATVLYTAICNAFNQFENHFDNQIENQNENAYVSVSVSGSVSVLGNKVIKLLSKSIICKEFSNNYGGRRTNSGRPSKTKNQTENQNDIQIENQNEKPEPKKRFTAQSEFYVDGQYFDEFPVEALPLLKKHWSDDELESIRKDLACKPDHETSVEQLLVQYPPLQKQAEEHFERFWSSYTPVKTTDGRVVSKGSRKEAEAKYMKIVKSGVNPDDILNGLRAYINDCQQNNRLTCGATVFLNQERWKDDYKPITAIAQQPMPQMPRMSLKEMKEMQNELEIQKILRGER